MFGFGKSKSKATLSSLSNDERFYIQLSKDAYTTPSQRKREYTFNNQTYINSPVFSDKKTLVLWNSFNKHLIIAYRGTASIGDVLTDVYYGFSKEGKTFRFKKELAKFNRMVDYYKPNKITLAGHSLAGGISLYINENSNKRVNDVYIVNPAFNLRNLKQANLNGNYSNTIIYKTPTDPVSYGSVLSNVRTKVISKKDGMNSHTIANFIKN